ncbi:hypothetical protein S40288_11313 [Stachybotrys chartarum IBT 40288]|nr:hypothetical protein S40288_11313 [Stachybotrys chartarum IBT 40288]
MLFLRPDCAGNVLCMSRKDENHSNPPRKTTSQQGLESPWIGIEERSMGLVFYNVRQPGACLPAGYHQGSRNRTGRTMVWTSWSRDRVSLSLVPKVGSPLSKVGQVAAQTVEGTWAAPANVALWSALSQNAPAQHSTPTL